MNWNFPAYVYAGDQRTYPVQLILQTNHVQVFEPSQQKFIFSFDYNMIRLFVDKQNQTLFRIIFNKQAIIFVSPYRTQIVQALQIYTCVMNHNPEQFNSLSKNCMLQIPILISNQQKLLIMNQQNLTVLNSLNIEELSLKYECIFKLNVQFTHLQLNYESNGLQQLYIEIIEELFVPLVYTCIASRIFMNQTTLQQQQFAKYQLSVVKPRQLAELSSGEDSQNEEKEQTIEKTENIEEFQNTVQKQVHFESEPEEQLSFQGAESLAQNQQDLSYNQNQYMFQQQNDQLLSSIQVNQFEQTNSLKSPEQVASNIEDNMVQSQDGMVQTQQQVQQDEQEQVSLFQNLNVKQTEDDANLIQILQQTVSPFNYQKQQVVSFEQQFNQTLGKLRKPLYCWKYMQKKKQFHLVQVFLPLEANDNQIRICWGDDKLFKKKLQQNIDVSQNLHSPISYYKWDASRSIDIMQYQIGLNQKESDYQEQLAALHKLSFKPDANQIFTLYSKQSKRNTLVIIFEQNQLLFKQTMEQLLNMVKQNVSSKK